MFDIGFSEIIFIMVIALVVVGPERLPRLARTAGLWVGKMRGLISSVKADIEHELATEELRKQMEIKTAVPELEELIDEVTGEPLSAGERTAGKPAAESTPESTVAESTPESTAAETDADVAASEEPDKHAG